ncbi:hypothetical protein V1511DRAFT_502019 [Dipodascopsis uninucleata]
MSNAVEQKSKETSGTQFAIPQNPSTRSCDSCRSRKIKCDRKEPCLQCTLRNVVCVYSARKKRKRRQIVDDDANVNDISKQARKGSTPESLSSSISTLDTVSSSGIEKRDLRGKLGQIEYHLEKLNTLLEEKQEQETQENSQESETQKEISRKLLDAKIRDQLRHMGASSLLSMSLDTTNRLVPDGSMSDLILKWSSELADKTTAGLSDEVADSLGIDSHRPYLPDQEKGLKLMNYYISTVADSQHTVNLGLANIVRDCVYKSNFRDDKYFSQKLAIGSYMMLQTLYDSDFLTQNPDAGGSSLENLLFRNIFLILRDVRVLFGATLLNIQALYIAAISAKQIYNPGLCWTIISHACRHCIALGLNHINRSSASESMQPVNFDLFGGNDDERVYVTTQESESERMRLFWSCYVLDKVLSLTFGRSSNFQTKDCCVPVPPAILFSTSDLSTLGQGRFKQSVELAFVYDSIYNRLYSALAEAELASYGPEGSAERTQKRGEVVNQLHEEVNTFWNSSISWINQVRATGSDKIATELYTEARYTHCICLAMIHRVHAEYSKASHNIYASVSREAMQLFIEIMDAQYDTNQRHAVTSWALVFQPLASFFGVFRAIAEGSSPLEVDEADLTMLQDISSALETLRAAGGGGVVRRLALLTREYLDVATEIIRRREKTTVKKSPPIELPNGSRSTTDSTADNITSNVQTPYYDHDIFASTLQFNDINTSVPIIFDQDQVSDEDTEAFKEVSKKITLPSWMEFVSDETITGGQPFTSEFGEALLDTADERPHLPITKPIDDIADVVNDFLESICQLE